MQEIFSRKRLPLRWQSQSRTLMAIYSMICAFTLLSLLYFWRGYRGYSPSSYVLSNSKGNSLFSSNAIANRTLGVFMLLVELWKVTE